MNNKNGNYILIPKKLFYAVLVIAVVAIGYWAFKPSATPVDIGEVSEGLFLKTFVEEGVTSFKNKYVISAPADGIVTTIDLKSGDAVKKNQVLFRFLWDQVLSSP